jgi:subtilase family serine protease/flagellar hook assembly protein FlgD
MASRRLALLATGLSLIHGALALDLRDCVHEMQPAPAKSAAISNLVGASQDVGNVTVMEVSGDYSRGADEPRRQIARTFYASHPDQYDFLITFTTFEFETGGALAFYNSIRNDTAGIGRPMIDLSADFGSVGRLQGYVDMTALGHYAFAPSSPRFHDSVDTLAHELMHRWGVKIHFIDGAGNDSADLIGQEGSHWSYFVDSDASIMYGSDWQAQPNGTFRSVDVMHRYSPLDLYLAGFAATSEVPPFTLIRNGSGGSALDIPELGASTSGSGETVTIEQVVAANGARVPTAANAQKDFNAALILLKRPGESVPAGRLLELERFRLRFQQQLAEMTDGRAAIHIFTQPRGSAVALPTILQGSGATASPGGVSTAVLWLEAHQDVDGHWQDRPATAMRETVATVRALEELDPGYAGLARARAWIAEHSVSNNDQRSWKLVGADQDSEATDLLAAQDPPGGFAIERGWVADNVDTGAVALAFADRGRDAQVVDAAAQFLGSRQNADGSLGVSATGAGRMRPTLQAASLWSRRTDNGYQQRLASASQWISAQAIQQTALADEVDTYALLGRLQLSSTAGNSTRTFVRNHQQVDGDWGGSIYLTATAALAYARDQRPNLALSAAPTVTPVQPRDGEHAMLRGLISNTGNVPIGPTVLRWFDGDPDTGGTQIGDDTTVPDLAAGSTVAITRDWDTRNLAGSHDLWVVLDATAIAIEASELDNRGHVAATVLPPSLQPDLALESSDFTLDPAAITTLPSTVHLSGSLRNIGGEDVEAAVIRLYARTDQAHPLAQTTVSVAARGSTAIALDFDVSTAASLDLLLRADPDGVVAEASETNNDAGLLLPFGPSLDLQTMASDLTLVTTPALVGRAVEFDVVARNRGTTDSPPVVLRVNVTQNAATTTIFDAPVQIAAGQVVHRRVSWLAEQPGLAQLSAILDPANQVAESDEGNNFAGIDFTVSALDQADLTFASESFRLTPEPGLEGQPLTATLGVRNLSTVATGTFRVALYAADPASGAAPIGSTTIASLDGSAQTTATVIVPDLGLRGDQRMFAKIDADDQVAEIDESNNVVVRALRIQTKPDLAVTVADIVLSPPLPVPGQAVQARVTVRNLGDQDAHDVMVRLLEGEAVGGVAVGADLAAGTIPAGASATLTWNWTLGVAPDAHSATAIVDPDDLVHEGSDANNVASLPYDVQSGDFFASERYISPNGDGVQDAAVVVFRTQSSVPVEVQVVNAIQHVVRHYVGVPLNAESRGQVLWDGHDDHGRMVPDGDYRFVVSGAGGDAPEGVLVAVDNNQSSLLEAVDTPHGVFGDLPAGMFDLRIPPASSPLHDEVFGLWRANSQAPLGLYKTDTVYPSAMPVISGAWLLAFGAANQTTAVIADFAFSQDGGEIVAILRGARAGGPVLWVVRTPVDRIDAPDVLAEFDGVYSFQVLGYTDPATILVGPDQSGMLDAIDVASHVVSPVRQIGSEFAGGMFTVVPLGVLYSNYGPPIAFLPRDPAKPILRLQPEQHEAGEFYDAQLSPTQSSVAVHRLGSRETVELVQLASAARTTLVDTPSGIAHGESSGEQRGVGHLGMGWLRSRGQLVVADALNGQLSVYSSGGQRQSRRDLPSVQTIGPYSPPSGSSIPFDPSNVLPETFQGLAGDPCNHRLDGAVGAERRIFDPVRNVLNIALGEVAARDEWIEAWQLVAKPGIRAYLRIDADEGEAEVIQRGTLLPLQEDADRAVYPLLEPCNGLPSMDFPELILRDGASIRTDGRVQTLGRGLLPQPWPREEERLREFWPDDSRVLLADQKVFATLQNLHAVLRARTLGRGIELSGIAADRNFASYRLEWAPIEDQAPASWQALLPATSEEVLRDEFLTWVPPRPGTFAIRLIVTDKAGNRASALATASSFDSSVIDNFALAPRYFSPNGDGIQDLAVAKYRVRQPATLAIRIGDTGGTIVRSVDLTYGAAELGTHEFAWDGRDNGGQLLPDGRYRLDVDGFAAWLTLDTLAPELAGDVPPAYVRSTDRVTVRPMVRMATRDRNAVRLVLESAVGDQAGWSEVSQWENASLGTSQDPSDPRYWRDVPLAASNYAGHRFRAVAADPAGNTRILEIGRAEDVLALTRLRESKGVTEPPDVRPGFYYMPPPFDAPDIAAWKPVPVERDSEGDHLDAANVVVGLVRVAVETADADTPQQWVERGIYPLDDHLCSSLGFCLARQADELRIPFDSLALPAGGRALVRIRGERADGSRVYSNQGYVQAGGIEAPQCESATDNVLHVRSAEYIDGSIVDARLHYVDDHGHEQSLAAEHVDDGSVYFDVPSGGGTSGWVTGTDTTGFSYRSPTGAMSCTGSEEHWETLVRRAPVIVDHCDGLPSNRIQLGMIVRPLPPGSPGGEPRPEHVSLSYVDGHTGARVILHELGEGQAADETYTISTEGWPEGEYQARMDIRYVDGSSRSRPINLPVTRQSPSINIETPRDGERVCAIPVSTLPPRQRIPAAVDLHSSVPGGFRMELGSGPSPSLFACARAVGETYSRPPARGEVCPPYDIISDFGVLAVDGMPADLVSDFSAYNGTATLRMKGLGWSGGTVCAQRTFVLDSTVEIAERATPHTVVSTIQATVPVVGISTHGHPGFEQGQFFLRSEEPVRIDASVHRAHIEPATGELLLDPESLGIVKQMESTDGDIDIAWNGTFEGHPVADGLYGIAIDAADGCTHANGIVYGALVDSTPPEVHLTAPAANSTISTAVVGIVGSVQDSVQIAAWQLDFATSDAPDNWRAIAMGTSAVRQPEILANWQRGTLVGPIDLRLTAIDAMGNQGETHLALILDEPSVLLGGAQAQPVLFSPNGDGMLDATRIQLDLLRAATVDVRVFDPADHLVAGLYSGPQPAGSSGYAWSGMDASGHVVADGTYLVHITAQDTSGALETTVLAVVVDATPPLAEVRRPSGAYASSESTVELHFDDAHFSGYEARLVRMSDGVQVAHESGVQAGGVILAALANFSEGRYALHAEAKDGAANTTVRDVEFDIDATAPAVTLETPTEGALIPSVNVTSVVGSISDAHLASWSLAASPEQSDTWTELKHGTANAAHGELFAWQPNLPDGRYRLRLRASDEAGNTSDVLRSIEIDGTAPIALITAPVDGGYLNGSGNIDGSATDAHFAGYRLSVITVAQAAGGQWSDIYNGTEPVDAGRLATLNLNLPENDYLLRLVVTDRAGLGASQQVHVRIDATPPPAPIGLAGHVDDNRDAVLDWNAVIATDLAGYQVYRDGTRITPTPISGTHYVDAGAPEGRLQYQVRAVDAAANESPPSNVIMLLVDHTPPMAQIARPVPAERVRGDLDVVGTAWSADDFKQYRLSAQVSNRPAEPVALAGGTLAMQGGLLAAWNTLAPEFQEGDAVTLRLEAEDIRGNIATATVGVVIDNTPPMAPTGLVASVAGTDAHAHWNPNSETDLLGYLLYRDNQLVNAGGPNLPADLRPFALPDVSYVDAHIADGQHTYVLYAIDGAGNVSPPSAPATLDPLDNTPPSMTIESPADGTRFETAVTVLATSRDTDIAEVRYSYRLQGASSWTDLGAPLTSAPYRITWTPAASVQYGTYQIRAVARDVGGRIDPAPPVVQVVHADMTAPPSPTGLLAHADGDLARLAWNASVAGDLAGYHVYRDGGMIATLAAAATTYDDTQLADSHYVYTVAAYDGTGNTSPSSNDAPVEVFGVDLDQPFTPTRLDAVDLVGHSARAGNIALHIETSQGTSDPAAGATSNTGAISLPARVLESGSNHFTLRVTDSSGNVSRPAELWIDRGVVPAMPQGLAATIDDHLVELSWVANGESDLLGYRVFRNEQPLAPDRLLGELPVATSASGDAAAAVDGNAQSYWAAYVLDGTAEAPDDPAIEFAWVEPRIVAGVDLDWFATRSGNFDIDAWSGHAWIRVAHVRGPTQASHQVALVQPYRTTRIRLVVHSTMTHTLDDEPIRLAELRMLERPVQGATSLAETVTDGNWHYRVSALSMFAFESEPSAAVDAAIGDTQGPEPVVLSGDLAGNAANLSWTASSSPDVAGYRLSRDDQPIASIDAGAPRAYVDSGLTLGSHVYVVRGYDAFDNEGPASNELTLTVVGDGPGIPVGLAVSAPDEGSALDIHWQPGSGAPPEYYLLRRAPSAGGPFEVVADTDQTSDHDAPLMNGTTYYYTVEAVDAIGNASGPSAPVSGTPRDRTAPQPPLLTYPTVSDAPVTMRADTSDVCGLSEAAATMAIERNAVGVASVVANDDYAHATITFADAFTTMPAPSGNRIARIDGAGVIRVVDLDNAVTMYASEPGTRLQAWAAHGEALYYFSWSDELFRWEPGRAPESLALPIGAVSGFFANSRGSAYLVVGEYAQSGGGAERGLWLVDAVGGTPRRIDGIDADTLSAESPPHWSPDGAYLLLVDTSGSLRLVDTAAAETLVVLPLGREAPTAWNHDGSRFAYVRVNAQGNEELQLFDVTTGMDANLQTYSQPITAIASSPGDDGIAVLSTYHLDLVDAAGGDATSLDTSPSGWDFLAWTASGRIFAGTDDRVTYTDLPGWFCARRVPLAGATNLFIARGSDDSGNHGFGSAAVEVDVPVAGLPDLAVAASDVFVVPSAGTTGDSYAVLVTLHNLGAVGIEHPELAVTLVAPDGRRTALLAAPPESLGAGQAVSMSYPIGTLSAAGSWRVEVAADPALRVRESDETNNAAYAAFAVSADGAPLLDLGLTRSVFAPGEAVLGEVGVSNTGTVFTGSVHIDVLDAAGTAVADLGDHAIDALGFGQRWHGAINWDAQGIFAGAYRMRARLFDASAMPLGEQAVEFSIDAVRHVALGLVPDAATQVTGHDVVAHSSLVYTDGNTLIDGAVLRLVISDAGGSEVWRHEQALGTLLPGYELARDDAWPTLGLAEGVYTLHLSLEAPGYDASVDATVTLSAPVPVTALTGSIAFEPGTTLVAGLDVTMRTRVGNAGTNALSGVQTRLRIVSVPAQVPIEEMGDSFDLGAGQVHESAATLSAPPLALVNHAAILEGRLPGDAAGEWRLLARQGFAVVDGLPPSITVLAPAAASIQPAVVQFRARVVDQHSAVSSAELRIDEGSWQPVSAGIDGSYARGLTGLVDGGHTLSVRARDAWGNETQTAPMPFTVDASPPVITITGVADGGQYGTVVTPVVDIDEAHLAGSDVRLDGVPFVSGTAVDAEGGHVLVARASDTAGNRSQRALGFTIDRTAPVVAIVAPADGAVVTTTAVDVDVLTEAFAITAVATGTYQDERIADAQGHALFADVPLIAGSNSITATAHDAVGNIGGPATIAVVHDPVAAGPLTGSLQPQGAELPWSMPLEVHVSLQNPNAVPLDAQQWRVRVLAGPTSLAEQAFTRTFAAHEEYATDLEFSSVGWPLGVLALALEVRQGADWLSVDSRTFEVVDRTPPQVAVLSPLDGDVVRSPVALRAAASDVLTGISAVEASVDGSDWNLLTEGAPGVFDSAPLTLVDGDHEAAARARDAAGNPGASGAVHFAVDTRPPLINVAGVGDGDLLAHAVTPAITVADPHLLGSDVRLNGQPYVVGSIIAASGDYHLDVQAVDSAGNTASMAITFTLDLDVPTLTFVSPLPGSVVETPSVDVVGQTEALARVHLANGTFGVDAFADADGRFAVAGVPLRAGDNTILAHATDRAGNVGDDATLVVVYHEPAEAAVEGQIAPFAAPWPQATPVVATFAVHNTGGLALPGLPLRFELRAAAGGDVLVEDTFGIDLPLGAQANGTRELHTTTLLRGAYSLALYAILPLPSGATLLDSTSLTLAASGCVHGDGIFIDGFDGTAVFRDGMIFCDGFDPRVATSVAGAVPWTHALAWLETGHERRAGATERVGGHGAPGRRQVALRRPPRGSPSRTLAISASPIRSPSPPLQQRNRWYAVADERHRLPLVVRASQDHGQQKELH